MAKTADVKLDANGAPVLVISDLNAQGEGSVSEIRGELQIARHMEDPDIAAAVAKASKGKRDQVAAAVAAIEAAEADQPT